MTAKYRSDIDGLRGIAVLAVVGFHAFPSRVRGGFVGVDIFFVISGFLISGIILKELERDSFSFLEFYVRRIKRIFPSLAVVLAACLLAGALWLLPDEYQQLGKHVAAGAAFGSNVVLWQEAGYFDMASELKPLLHLWSLGIEEQFYLVWPAVLALVLWRMRAGRGLLMSMLMIGSFSLSLWRSGTGAFFLPFTRFWELLSGCLLALPAASPERLRLKRPMVEAAAGVGLLLLASAMVLIDRDRPYPGRWALLPVLGTVLPIVAGSEAWVNKNILSQPSLVFVGLISYPLYLWHWPLLTFGRTLQGGTLSIGLRLVAVLASAALAALTYQLVEKPVRFGRRNRLKPIALCLAMIILGWVGLSTSRHRGFPSRFGSATAALVADLRYDTSQLGYSPCDARLKASALTLMYCFQSSPSPPTAAVFGDSHGDHVFAGIAALDEQSWLMVGHPSCPPISGVDVKLLYEGCERRSDNAIRYLAADAAIKTVVLSFGNYIADTNYAADHLQSQRGPRAAVFSSRSFSGTRAALFYAGLDQAVTRLEAAGKEIIVFHDVPELPFFPRACIPRGRLGSARTNCFIPRAAVLDRQHETRALLARLSLAHPRVRLFDPLETLCDAEICPVRLGDRLLYRDSHHLSLYGSVRVARAFLQWRTAARHERVDAPATRRRRPHREPAAGVSSAGGIRRWRAARSRSRSVQPSCRTRVVHSRMPAAVRTPPAAPVRSQP
jgi:peptidoglycan/LPS O-acetylase OafA/YrhL